MPTASAKKPAPGISTIMAAVGLLFSAIPSVHAGTISYVGITNDADSDISNTKTYTHTVDLNGSATVNGVAFTSSPANFSLSASANGNNAGSPQNNPAPDLGNLMQGFQFMAGASQPPGTSYTMTLSGLTAGTTYDLRIYTGQWDTNSDRSNTITFDPDGAGPVSDSVTIDQNDASTVPGESFAANAIYYINYRYTAVAGEDLVVEIEIANSDNASWHLYGVSNEVFSPDTTPPSLVSVSPPDDSAGAPVFSDFVATFDENVALTATGTITVTDGSETRVINLDGTADDGDASVTDNVVTITLDADLTNYLSTYDVLISNDAIVDTSPGQNAFSGTVAGDWNFTTAALDATAPSASTYSPANGESGVLPNTSLIVLFDEDVKAGAGDILIREFSGDTIVSTIDVTSGDVSITGAKVTINPPSLLGSNTQYYVEIPSGAILDLSSNPFSGFSGSGTWSFTTSAPIILDGFSGSFTAGNGAMTGRSPDVVNTPGFTYTEQQNANAGARMELDTSTGNPSNSLKTGFNNSAHIQYTGAVPTVPITLSLDAQLNTLADDGSPRGVGLGFWNPLPTLFPGTLPSSTTNFTGIVVNPAGTLEYVLNGTSQGTFTTAPAGFSTNDFLKLTYTVDPVTGTLTEVIYAGTDYTADFAAVNNFTPSIHVGFLGSTASNLTFFGRVDNFAVETVPAADVTPPLALTFAPANGESGVSANPDLVVTFDENVQAGSGDILIREFSGDAIVSTIDVTSGSVTFNGPEVSIDVPDTLAFSTEHYVEIPSGAILDLYSNPFAGFSGSGTWNFTTMIEPTQIGPGADVAGTFASDNANQERMNIALSSPAGNDFVNLPAGTYNVVDFQLNVGNHTAGIGGAGTVAPMLLTGSSGSWTTLWVGGDVDPTSNGIQTAATYAAGSETFTLAVATDVYAGIFTKNQGSAIPLTQAGVGKTDHDNSYTAPTGPGQTVDGFSNPNLTRFYVFEVNVVPDGTASTPYDTWADGFLPTDVSDPAGNGDGDSLTNLLEFAFGTNPTLSDAVSLNPDGSVNGVPVPVASGGGGGVTFDYLFVRRDDHGASGSVTYTPQFSSDLTTFYDSSATPDLVADSTDDPAYEIVKVPYPAILPDGKKARFARMKVDEVP